MNSNELNPDQIGDAFQALFIQPQKPVSSLEPVETRVTLACHPPLGQLSKVRVGPVNVIAVLEVHPARQSLPWEVSLWHSIDEGIWGEVALKSIINNPIPTSFQGQNSSKSQRFLMTTLQAQETIYFTLKYREGPDADWRWIRDETGLEDGMIVVENPTPFSFSKNLHDYISNLNRDLRVESLLSQSPKTELWSVKTSIQAQDIVNVNLGMPWGSFYKWFALVRLWQPWLAPRHGKTEFQIDKDALICSFQNSKGMHMVILGVSGLNNVSTVLRNGELGQVILRIRNDGANSGTANILVAVGEEFENTLASVMYQARAMVTNAKSAIEAIQIPAEYSTEIPAENSNEEVHTDWMELWYDGLGYCTWNALGQRLTSEKIFKALDTLAENNIDITSLIIDDNWQSIDYKGDGQFQYGWMEFEADSDAFPQGLRGTVERIRTKHNHIHHIVVWHALLGYWGGVNPNGDIGKKYKTIEVMREEDTRRNLPLGGKMHIVAREDVHRMYEDFYRFLRNCGIDGVKTDAQFMIDMLSSFQTRRDHIKTYLDAWTLSTLRYFGSKAISCMSQTPDILFYTLLATNRPAFLCRNSDDFFPEIPSSHPWHVWTNAHNALLTRHLNVLPDWDMFQTDHDYSGFHAAARCISGGPIYITDVPGKHNIDLLKQMTGKTTRGKTVIFRTSVVGRSIDTYIGYHDNILLKIGTYHAVDTGRYGTGASIIGIFNTTSCPLTELIALSRFPGVVTNTEYIVKAHTTDTVTKPLTIGSLESVLPVSLGIGGYEILTAYPATRFMNPSKVGAMIWVSSLGLLGKMASGATIVWNRARLQNERVDIEVRLKALGTVGFYISSLPTLTLENDFIATMQNQVVPPHTTRVSRTDKHVLEIDIEAAWKEMRLQPGWSNEAQVKIYFNLERKPTPITLE